MAILVELQIIASNIQWLRVVRLNLIMRGSDYRRGVWNKESLNSLQTGVQSSPLNANPTYAMAGRTSRQGEETSYDQT
jgi:hypothetical protein